MGATIRDVAKRAGVGTGTVSRVLNDHAKVDPETRRRVLAAIADLDYAPSPVARRLSLGRTMKIGVVCPGWQSSPEEGTALMQTLLAFQAAYPDIQVDYQPIAGEDYPAAMTAKFASSAAPDVLYVDASYARAWIREGYLAPLDGYIARSGFDTSKFFSGYASIFKGDDGKTYGLPKDGNTIGLAYNSRMVSAAPTTLDELVDVARRLRATKGLSAPMCLNPGLDRGLAFLYAQGGSLVSDDGTSVTIDSEPSRRAVQWYLDLFKEGLAMTAAELGVHWSADALGREQVAMVFEGGWLDPAMNIEYPAVDYAWAPFPTGWSGEPVTIAYTVSYSIPAHSKHQDAAWILLSYLTGKEGMTKWMAGGVALPSRSDVPIPPGKEVLAGMSKHARPGSGFLPGYIGVVKAFEDAFNRQLADRTYDAEPVVRATAKAIDQALTR